MNQIKADLGNQQEGHSFSDMVSQHPRRKHPPDFDKDLYKWRHLIENFFGKLKEFKRSALRADKTDQSFEAMIYLAAAIINSR